MINAVNYKNLEYLFKETKENVCLFAPIFNRKSGKTTSLLKLAEKNNGIYVGASADICKLAKRINPNIKAFSPTQILNRHGAFDENDVFIIDEVEEKEIERLRKAFPHTRIFGLVKWEKSPNWMTLNFTENLLDDKNSDISNKNTKLLKEFYNEKSKSGMVLKIISGLY